MDRTSWGALGARPLVFPALAIGLGVALGVRPGAPAWPALLAAGLCLFPPLFVAERAGAHLLLLLGFGAVGATLGRLQAMPVAEDAPPGMALLEGRVLRAEATERCRLTLAVQRWDGVLRPTRVQLSLYEAVACPLPGSGVRVRARVQPLEGPTNPGGTELRARRLREGLTHRGSADGRGLLMVTPPPLWEVWMDGARAALTREVQQRAPTPEAGALFLTLSAGQRAALGPELEEVFSRSGLAHVLSVSGLHVAALALVLLGVLRRFFCWVPLLGRGIDPRQLAAPLAVPLVWGFVAWTGWQPPAVRSALMASAALLGLLARRSNDALNTVAASAALLFVVDPACIADLSMQLSFLAVLALILVVPALGAPAGPTPGGTTPEGWRHRLRQALEACRQSLLASVAVTLAGAPLIATVFGRLSLSGLISNIVCMPLSGLLTLLAAGGAGLHVVAPSLAGPVLWVGGWASEVFLWVARFFSAVPLATLPVPPPAPGSIAAWALGLCALAVGRGRSRWLALLLPLAAVWTLAFPHLRPAPPLRITFLSVGQGDGIVISAGGQHALIDAGGVPRGTDTGRRYVLPYLRAQGIDALDLVVLSHPHPDHGLGLVSVLETLPTRRLWLASGTAEGPLSRQLRTLAGEAIVEEVSVGRAPLRLGEATLEVLGPPPAERWDVETVNDRSVVIRVSLGEVRVLLTGDIEAAGEAALEAGPVTVLKAPHHGSRTSSSEALLDQTRPAAVVMSLGRHNRYAFPHPEVHARYRSRGIPIYRTDLHGAVTLESDGRQVRLSTFLPSTAPLPRRLVATPRGAELGTP